MLFVERIYQYLVKFLGKGVNYLDCEQNKSRFQFCLKKNKISMLDLLSNVLGVLRALLHLIKKKIYGEGVINIPIL